MSETVSPAISASKSSEPLARIEEQDLEDGPLFRATVTQLEGKTSALKQNVKRILKAATHSLEAKRALLEADAEFVRVLRDIPCVDPLFTHYLNDTWPKMHEQWERLEHSMQSLLVDPLRKLYEMDIKAAEAHKRQFEEESKDYYAHLSKYLSIKKSSSSKKDDAAADTTSHANRKQHFDLSRFDYYSFLMDLHGGKKNQELLYHLLSYQQKQFAFYQTIAATLDPHKRGLDELAAMMAEAAREQNLVNKERYEKRKQLELKIDRPSATRTSMDQQSRNAMEHQAPLPTVIVGDMDPSQDSDHLQQQQYEQQQQQQQNSVSNEAADDVPPLSSEDRFRGIRDLQQQDRELISGSGRRKEGFLFATSKPSKSNVGGGSAPGAQWHKYWCVLSGGQLHEYSNWKGQLQTHIDPINLRFATAREARHTDRRFCFEVITTHFRRVYQATSQEEMQSWIATINNAIESLLNGMGSSIDLVKPVEPGGGGGGQQPQKKRQHVRTLSGALRSGLGKRQSGLLGDPHDLFPAASSSSSILDSVSDAASQHTQQTTSQQPASSHQQPTSSHQQRFRWSSLSFGKSSSMHHTHHPPASSYPIESAAAIPNTELLSQLKQDPSNAFCADCRDPNPEWCSLNLGIVLCIECSGIHRSLGTHISKIRSLTLDSTSYTPDIVALLRALGNERSNAIWSATATTCPKPDDTRNTKLKYIQAKYVYRAFVDNKNDQTMNPHDLLFDAIDRDDIPAAMSAIALGADVNACSQDASIPMLLKDHAQDDEDEWSIDRSTTEYAVRYPLHLALLHGRATLANKDERELVFPMAELLLQNGVDTGLSDPATGYTLSELVGIGDLVEDEAIRYLNTKNAARGLSLISRSSMPPPHHSYNSSSIGSDKLIV